MDYTYSSQTEAGGALHLPSPTQGLDCDRYPSIDKIRRSLSRSPSKSRFNFHRAKSPHASPRSPLSPVGFPKALSPSFGSPRLGNSLFTTPLVPSVEPKLLTSSSKKKFALRRTAAFRSTPRVNATPRSPVRRALGETMNLGNITPSNTRRSSQEQSEYHNTAYRDSSFKSASLRLDLNDEPVKFEYAPNKQRDDNMGFTSDFSFSAKASPLKRDVSINLEVGNSGSPRAKRRSLHAQLLGSDLDFLSQAAQPTTTFGSSHNGGNQASNPFASPAPKRTIESPLRKSLSLRKSTLQQRQAQSSLRPRHSGELSRDTPESSPLHQPRNRMSLPNSLLDFHAVPLSSPFVRSTPAASANPFVPARPITHRSSLQTYHPHPLSNTLTPSPITSAMPNPEVVPATVARSSATERLIPIRHFSRSLPLGASRPSQSVASSQESQASSFATPEAFKHARPNPAAFMSTGLISKRNRNVDFQGGDQFASYAMPDTPSKRASYPPAAASPFPQSAVKPRAQPNLERNYSPVESPLGRSSGAYGRRSNIFDESLGNRSLNRNASFLSEADDENAESPTGGQQQDSQSSADELPPTPTKPSGKPKENSLRSSLFGRRTSLGPETFVAPDAVDIPAPKHVRKSESGDPSPNRTPRQSDYVLARPAAVEASTPTAARRRRHSLPSQKNRAVTALSTLFPRGAHTCLAPIFESGAKSPLPVTATPVGQQGEVERNSPHTPQEIFAPPDPSRLSISGGNKNQPTFGSSASFNAAFPPATPTAPRDQSNPFGFNGLPVAHVTQNDVDTSLTARFGIVTKFGNGEFSEVYRVENRLNSFRIRGSSPSSISPSTAPSVWAVKKSKKPYAGPRDRERKLREVEILQGLRGNEHIINLVDHWELHGHLYIQTEFCEDGNLKDFLSRAGYKGRLDDFRIWKILLELSLGVKHIHEHNFIHLDLKPANVFIDFEGVLKIGDFGLASTWPAPPYIEGEGDREYIGPEILDGLFDKPADIFALGMIMLEIAGNIVLPDNGVSWQRLRAGDMSDLPSLTWSSDSTLARDESGEPITESFGRSTSPVSPGNAGSITPIVPQRTGELTTPPNFMVDPDDEHALDKVVQWMISPNPGDRPTVGEVYNTLGVQWVEHRRRSGATIYEGNWGPSDDVLEAAEMASHAVGDEDVDMVDAD